MELLYRLEALRTPFFDTVFSALTHLGEETVFLVAAIFVFWCVSKREGYYLLTVGFLGTVCNQCLKLLCRIPRPWVLDGDFTIVESARAQATGYSFPSGHTQNAVGTFGAIARYTTRRWLRWVMIAAAVLVSFSRLYLGVHTPLDVGVSLVLGTALIFLIYPLIRQTEKTPRLMGLLIGVMVVCSGAFLLYALYFPFPSDMDAANLASGTEAAWKLFGATLGFLLAWWIDERWIHFDTKAAWWVQLIKLSVGLGLLLAIKAGLKAPLIVLIGTGTGDALRYFLVVLFTGAVWPLVFAPLRRLEKRKQ